MTQTELAKALNLTKGAISQLVQKGMPMSSVDAANAWRLDNAPPRRKRGQPVGMNIERPAAQTPPPALATPPAAKPAPSAKPARARAVPVVQVEPQPLPPEPPPQPDPVAEAKDADPKESVKMARMAEKVAWKRFAEAQKNALTSPEEFRRINSAYIAARQNRMKAEQDFRDWRRQEGITLFLSEAQEIAARPHQAAAHMLSTMPKQLAPRLQGQPLGEMERTLAEWCDGLATMIRQGI